MRTHPPVRPALLALGVGLTLQLTGCGGGAAPVSAPASAPQAVDSASTVHNEADLAFVNGMHPHHQGAVTMSELAATRAGSQQVKDLAARIAQAQGPEMTRMERLAETWGTELTAGHQHGDMDMSADSSALEGLSGTAFDRAFLTRMTTHHEAALPMARAEVASGSSPQAKEMAQQIVEVQQSEIAEMRELLAQL